MIKTNNIFFLAATAILSYMLADIIHEVVGHAGTALLKGHEIKLLTSVYFKSIPGHIFIDIGGPIASLIFGFLSLYLFTKTSILQLLFFQLAAYNLFWFSGGVLESAISETGDWTIFIENISKGSFQKILCFVTGILIYALVIKLLNACLNSSFRVNQSNLISRQDLFLSFLFASISACAAGLFYRAYPLNAAWGGLREMMGSLPILFLNFGDQKVMTIYQKEKKALFTISVFFIYAIFCLTLGRGIAL